MGKSDPYLEFSRQMPDGKFVVVHRTEVLTPLLLFFSFTVSFLCRFKHICPKFSRRRFLKLCKDKEMVKFA